MSHNDTQAEVCSSDGVGAWRPIETAPRGARGYAWMMLAWGPDEDKCVGAGMHAEGKFFAAANIFKLSGFPAISFEQREVQPTHWQPMPAWGQSA